MTALYKVRFELNDGSTFTWMLHSAESLASLLKEAQVGDLGLLMFEVTSRDGDTELFISEPAPVQLKLEEEKHAPGSDIENGSSDGQSLPDAGECGATLSM